jgi:hypothetical protein
MAGTLGALRLIERTAVGLCRALDETVSALDRALPTRSGPVETGSAAAAAEALVHRLQLWRSAWGPAEDLFPLNRIITLAKGLPNRVAVDVSALPGDLVFPAPLGRIVLNILLLAAESLPEGGHIVLAGAINDLFVRIDGPTAAWPAGMALCLAQEAEAQSALTDGRNLQMAVTASLAHATDIRLSALIPPAGQFEPTILHLGG